MIYRGTTKEGKVVEGYLIKYQSGYMIFPNTPHARFLSQFVSVTPSSLAMSTGISDKNKVPIYGSFEVDGVMSEGGDRIRNDENAPCMPGQSFDVKWLPGHFVAGGILGAGDHIGEDCEVIPKQEKE